MIVYLSVFALFLFFIHILFNYNERARLINKIPGPKGSFIVGNGSEIIVSPVELMKLGRIYSKKWKGIFKFWAFPFGAVNIYNPEDIETVISSVKFNDKSIIYNLLVPWLREGLLISKGEKWQQRRKLLTPAFHFNILRQFYIVLRENSQRLVEKLDKSAGDSVDIVPILSELDKSAGDSVDIVPILSELDKSAGDSVDIVPILSELDKSAGDSVDIVPILSELDKSAGDSVDIVPILSELDKSAGDSVDIVPILSEFTLHSICETAMGTKLSEEVSGAGKTYKETIYDLGKILLYRFTRLYLYSDFIFSWSSAARMMNKYLKIVHNFTERVINDRREYMNKYGIQLPEDNEDDDDVVYKQKKKTAMLDLLLLAEREGHINTTGIQEEVDTFMFEGHDTTASGLTFCLLSLANNKVVQDKVFNELQEIFGDSTKPATMADLTKMKYLEMCIKESLRLYPPVHFISRQLHDSVVLSGYKVPGNSQCHINILDLHRSTHLYENPLDFDPDRFLPENSAARHPYAYIPFSAGPRNCIGQKFAMMEMKSAVSEILRKFVLMPVTRHEDIEFMADLVLRNTGPVYVTFVKR